MIVKKDSILYRTNQAWKFNVPQIGFLLILLLFGLAFLYSTKEWQHNAYIAVSVTLCFASLLIQYTIKCPSCKTRWWWEAIKQPLSSKAITALVSQQSCPKCGFTK
jgi:protein-S-isoprenylcysteine O-methyltransferase Ste14